MAQLFGEVVYPKSRAFWTEDDEDDDEEATEKSDDQVFSVEWLDDIPSKIPNLIVAETQSLAYIDEHIVKDSKVICTIKSTTDSASTAVLYRVTKDLIVCTISPKFDKTIAGDLIESIYPILDKTEGIEAVVCSPKSQLKCVLTENTQNWKILRTRTADDGGNAGTRRLNPPNIVSGVVAGVVAYAEMIGCPATLNIFYLDNDGTVDNDDRRMMIHLLSKLVKHDLPEACEFGKAWVNKGNLYL